MSVPAVRVDAAAVYIRLLLEQAQASRVLLLCDNLIPGGLATLTEIEMIAETSMIGSPQG